MILVLDNVLDGTELARARDLLARATWVDGNITAGAQAAQMKNNWQLPEDAPALPTLRSIVLTALGRHALFFSAALPQRIFPPLFNRYGGARNAFGDHVDGAVRRIPGGETALRTDLSMTLFLTPPEDYDGGELVFQDGSFLRRIKGAAGSLVLYPSTTVHRVEPVTRGERVSCFTWIQSLVRRQDQRSLLFDMDMALIDVRAALGEQHRSAIALTGTYHNLLRQWAEP
ncbi:MAG: Fe2+-dependent dioxygenase [Casimicrobiaceae bacterium]|nr:Fe2+-dependent dioxygenase [Casimicrobiaceae bacterium]